MATARIWRGLLLIEYIDNNGNVASATIDSASDIDFIREELVSSKKECELNHKGTSLG